MTCCARCACYASWQVAAAYMHRVLGQSALPEGIVGAACRAAAAACCSAARAPSVAALHCVSALLVGGISKVELEPVPSKILSQKDFADADSQRPQSQRAIKDREKKHLWETLEQRQRESQGQRRCTLAAMRPYATHHAILVRPSALPPSYHLLPYTTPNSALFRPLFSPLPPPPTPCLTLHLSTAGCARCPASSPFSHPTSCPAPSSHPKPLSCRLQALPPAQQQQQRAAVLEAVGGHASLLTSGLIGTASRGPKACAVSGRH